MPRYDEYLAGNRTTRLQIVRTSGLHPLVVSGSYILKCFTMPINYTDQVSSKLSSNDKYSTMEKFVDILSRDINNWQNTSQSRYPLLPVLTANIALFLPDRTFKSPIGDLLSNHFTSTPYKVFLCLACLPEEENPELPKPAAGGSNPNLLQPGMYCTLRM